MDLMELKEKEVAIRLKASEIYEYDAAGYLFHYERSNDEKWWCECDTAGNVVHYKSSYGK